MLLLVLNSSSVNMCANANTNRYRGQCSMVSALALYLQSREFSFYVVIYCNRQHVRHSV